VSKETNVSAECKACGRPLPISHQGPCPSCGSEQRLFKVNLSDTLKVTARMSWQKTSEATERHPRLYPLLLALTVGAIVAGFLGPIGGVVGAALTLIAFWLGPHAIKTIRQIERGGDP